MSGESKIEWTGRTWNPLVGCSKVSGGCKYCYAERDGNRLKAMGVPQYQDAIGDDGRWTGQVVFVPKKLDEPLRRKEPTTYFVNSMSDLFHEDVPFETIDKIFAVMALAQHHTFQILTKRADRMREYFIGFDTSRIEPRALRLANSPCAGHVVEEWFDDNFPNVWLGVSVEDQESAEMRIPHLLATRAAVRFLSCEPLLGPVDFSEIGNAIFNRERSIRKLMYGPTACNYEQADSMIAYPEIDWVIVGGESGPNARPMDPNWARLVRDQCQASGVPFFFKQWGEYNKEGQRVGKKAAGRLLDSREWNEMPYTEVAQ